MFKNSQIPIWVNIFLAVLILFMAVQVYQFYFDHPSLLEAGITIQGVPDQNIMFTTAGRLVAMIGASIFVLITKNPNQHLVIGIGEKWVNKRFLPFTQDAHKPDD